MTLRNGTATAIIRGADDRCYTIIVPASFDPAEGAIVIEDKHLQTVAMTFMAAGVDEATFEFEASK